MPDVRKDKRVDIRLHEIHTNEVFVGKLIAFEGIRGSGKTTQMRLLDVWLQNLGAATYITSKESSKLVSKLIKKAKEEHALDPVSYNLAFAADMIDRIERDLIPSLNSGLVVFSERYVLDLIAHGVVRGCPIDWLQKIYEFAPKPDVTIYIDIDPSLAMKRLRNTDMRLDYYTSGRDFTGIKNETESFLVYQSKLREFFKKRKDENFIEIDGSLPIPKQQIMIRKAIKGIVDDYLSLS
jgi:dTMP kinase